MKKFIIETIALMSAYTLQAQVAIGKTRLTNTSVLLEFNEEAKGIILPSVKNAPGAVGGTFIVNTDKKVVEYHNGTEWVNLTDLGQALNHSYTNPQITDKTDRGVIIGSKTSRKPGVLVLESNTRAMVLPKVSDPVGKILSPIAGTLAYDTVSDSMAVFDGKNWSFWQ